MLADEVFNQRQSVIVVKHFKVWGVKACWTIVASSVDADILFISVYQLIGGRWETLAQGEGRIGKCSFAL